MTRPGIEPSSDSNLQLIIPNCFLRPNVNSELILKLNVQNIWETGVLSRDVFITIIEIRDEMSLKFREMWNEEYLLSLRENCKEYSEKIKIDDVVLIKNSVKPRPYWQLSRGLHFPMEKTTKYVQLTWKGEMDYHKNIR